MIAAKTRSRGALRMISSTDAGAPMTAKNMWIRKVPISCDPAIFPRKRGKAVASAVVIVVISRYWLLRRPRSSEMPNPSPAKTVSKKPASILETATIMQAAANPMARSMRETGRAFQYSAARLLCVLWCSFTFSISDGDDSISSRRSMMGCLYCLRIHPRDGSATSTKK